jgi:hypothetical protein
MGLQLTPYKPQRVNRILDRPVETGSEPSATATTQSSGLGGFPDVLRDRATSGT